MSDSSFVRTIPRPLCPVCQKQGLLAYTDLQDRLFNTPGLWTMNKCSNEMCKTHWLNPTPHPEDIYKLYSTYSTHSSPSYTPPQPTGKHALLEAIRSAFLFHDYGYAKIIKAPSWLRFIAYLHPGWKDTQAANIFYIPKKEDGLLLDVGCGNGSSLQMMQSRGWKVMGTDFDEKAVAEAVSKGLDVRLGELSSFAFPDETFDAIMMNHVIEHVPDPLSLIKECHRILKKGGTLSMITPNTASRGHALYTRNWRGLETPQHLQIFSVHSLGELTKKIPFSSVSSISSIQGVQYILDSSFALSTRNTADIIPTTSKRAKLLHGIHFFILGWKHVLLPGGDEVIACVAKK